MVDKPQKRAGWVFWLWIPSCRGRVSSVRWRLDWPLPLCPPLSPRPELLIRWEHHFKQEQRRNRRMSHGLRAQFSLNSYLEEKHCLKEKGMRRCSCANHTDKSLTDSATNWGSSEQTLLCHLPGRLALGFKCLCLTMGLQEHCIKKGLWAPIPLGQEKGKSRPWAFKFKLSYFRLHYFYQGFKGLRTKFHEEISSRKTILFSLFKPFEEGQSDFF